MNRKELAALKREQRDQDVADLLAFDMDRIAASIGIPSHFDREWTDEEAERVWIAAGGSKAPSAGHAHRHSDKPSAAPPRR